LKAVTVLMAITSARTRYADTPVLGFLPFALFAVFDRFVPTAAALLVAAVASALLLLRDRWRSKPLKLLDVGAFVLFGGLAACTALTRVTWSVLGVRLGVDVGLFVIVVISIARGMPFTLEYAREYAPPEVWSKPEFLHVNLRLSGAWAAAFGVMVLADFAMLRQVPLLVGVAATLLALGLALAYTVRVVRERRRARADARAEI
jgi:hypothetical protein